MYISQIFQKTKSESIDRVMFVQSNCIQLHNNLNELKTPNPNQNNQYANPYTDHVLNRASIQKNIMSDVKVLKSRNHSISEHSFAVCGVGEETLTN